MTIPVGLCICGCGGKTNPAPQTSRKRGWIKGVPVKFIHNHHCKGSNNWTWKGGRGKCGVYIAVTVNGKRQYEHRIIAEKVLGKPLPPNSHVHHYNGYEPEQKAQLVICENASYHRILHARETTLKACGHANWRKCKICHKYDDPQNLYIAPSGEYAFHRKCNAKYQKERRDEIKEVTMIDFNAANQEFKAPVGATIGNPEDTFQGGGTFVDPELASAPNEVAPIGALLDLTKAKSKLRIFEKAIKDMARVAKEHEITNEKSNIEAVEMAGQVKKLNKQLNKVRVEITDEPRLYVNDINAFSKVYTSELDDIERSLKNKIGTYAHKVEMARRETERKAQEEAKKLQAKIDKEAKEKNIEPVQVAIPVLPTKPEPTRTESGSASIRKDWKWKEVDKSKVPHEYLMLDTVKINKAVRAGVRAIPGIEIYEESTTVLRT